MPLKEISNIKNQNAKLQCKIQINQWQNLISKIQQESLKIIENEGIYSPSTNFFGGIFGWVLSVWSLLSNLYLILVYISILGYFSKILILWSIH